MLTPSRQEKWAQMTVVLKIQGNLMRRRLEQITVIKFSVVSCHIRHLADHSQWRIECHLKFMFTTALPVNFVELIIVKEFNRFQ